MYDINDRCVSVSLWALAAGVAWLAAALLITYGVTSEVDDATQVGLGFSALGATLSMRGFCVRLGCKIENAFELGRDVGRAEVRSLR